jgi:hypothetical protein
MAVDFGLGLQPSEVELHSTTLQPAESLALTREERVHRRWAVHDGAWRRFQARVSSQLGRPAEDSLGAVATNYRSKVEELALLAKARARDPVASAGLWSQTLRGGGPRYLLIGNPFTGIYAPIPQSENEGTDELPADGKPTSPLRLTHVRYPTGLSVGKAAAGSGGGAEGGGPHRSRAAAARSWRERGEFARVRAALGPKMVALRPHEVTEEDAEGLVVRGVPLALWASGALAEVERESRAAGGDGGAAGAPPSSVGSGGSGALEPSLAADAARAALIARGVWRVESRAERRRVELGLSQPLGASLRSLSALGAPSAGGAPSSTSGSVFYEEEVDAASALLKGPFLQALVLRDAVTGAGDVGESLGPGGFLRRIKAATAGSTVPGSSEAGDQGPRDDTALPAWAASDLFPEEVGGGGGKGVSLVSAGAAPAALRGGGGGAAAPPTPLVVLQASSYLGTPGSATVRLANCGTVALQYEWCPTPRAEDCSASGTALSFTLPLAAGNGGSASRFVASLPAGSLLPGSWVDCAFSLPPGAPGVYREGWTLRTVPAAAAGGAPFRFTLRGVCTGEGEAGAGAEGLVRPTAVGRGRLGASLATAAAHAMVRGLLSDIIGALPLGAAALLCRPPPRGPVPSPAAAFEAANPGLRYAPQVCAALAEVVAAAEAAAEADAKAAGLPPAPPQRAAWNGSLAALSRLLAALAPAPETEAEAAARASAAAVYAEARAAYEEGAAARAAEEAARARAEEEAAAAAAEEAAKKAPKKGSGSAAGSKVPSRSPSAGSKPGGGGGGSESGGSRAPSPGPPSAAGSKPVTPAGGAKPGAAATSKPPSRAGSPADGDAAPPPPPPPPPLPAFARRAAAMERARASLQVRAAAAALAAAEQPPAASPLYASFRAAVVCVPPSRSPILLRKSTAAAGRPSPYAPIPPRARARQKRPQ